MDDVDQVQLNFNPAMLAVLNILIGLIMFGVALDIRIDDFKRVVRDPRGPLIGLGAQFLLLPAMTFVLVLIFGFFDGLGGMAIIAAWWGVWHLISGLTIATYWSRRPVPIPEYQGSVHTELT